MHLLHHLGREPRPLAQLQDVLAQPRAELLAVEDEGLVVQLAQAQRPESRQRVLDMRRNEQRFALQHPRAQRLCVGMPGRAHETQVQPAFEQLTQLLARRLLAQRQPHLGPGLAKVAEQPREHLGKGHRTREPYGQLATFAPAGLLCGFGRARQLRQHRARLRKQRLARRGQADSASPALEQPHPQLALQRRDALGQRRLRNVQALRRARKVPFLGDRDEGPEVLDIHTENISK